MQVHRGILIFIIIAACLASYFNSLFADFVWDDKFFISENPYIRSFKFLPFFLFMNYRQIGTNRVDCNYYRPLMAAYLMLAYTLWHDNPFGYHLTNLILHALCCVLLFLFAELLSKGNKVIAFVSALLFAVHPLNTEAVNLICGGTDIIPCAFLLASLILFLKSIYKEKRAFYCLSLIFFYVSLLAKEMAATLPLIIVCVDYLFLSRCKIERTIKNFPKLHLGFFATLGVYLLARTCIIGWSFITDKSAYQGINFISGSGIFWRLFTASKILAYYIRLLFFPYDLKPDYIFPPSNSLFETAVLAGFVLIILFFSIAIKNTKRHPILSFSIIWFFITTLPVSNLFPQFNIFSERYMYIPSVGFCIGIAFLFSKLLKKNVKTNYLDWRKSLYVLFILLIIACGRVTYERNKVWQSDIHLWSDTVKAAPNSIRAHFNLGHAYFGLNLFDKALSENQIVLQSGFSNLSYLSLNAAGHIYLKKGLIEEAIKAFKLAIDISADNAIAYESLATVYSLSGQYKESIQALLMSLKRNPYLDRAYYNLSLNYYKIGMLDEAIKAYEYYSKIHSDIPEIYVGIGNLYYEKRDFERAKEYWLKALKVSKQYQPAKDALRMLEK